MGNRVENYLTDLAYALDYAYNAKTANPNNLTVTIGQSRRLNNATGNVNIGGAQCVIACSGQTTHENDLITCVLTLRNVANLNTSTTTIASTDVVQGHSAYDCEGTLITGSIVPKTIDDVTMTPGGTTAASGKSCSNISCQYPQVTIPKGCYDSELKVGFDLTAYNPVQKSQQQFTACACYDTAADIVYTNNAATVTHNCRNIKITTPKGYYSAARTLTICGPTCCYACNTIENITNTTTATGSKSFAAGYYANAHGACYKHTVKASTDLTCCVEGNTVTVTVPAGYYASNATKSGTVAAASAIKSYSASNNKLAVTPCAGYWNGTTAASTGINYYTSTGATLTSASASVTCSFPTGYYSENHSVTYTYVGGSGAPTLANDNGYLKVTPAVGYWNGSTGVKTTTPWYASGSGGLKAGQPGTSKGYICVDTAGYYAKGVKLDYDTSNLSSFNANCVASTCKYVGSDGIVRTGSLTAAAPTVSGSGLSSGNVMIGSIRFTTPSINQYSTIYQTVNYSYQYLWSSCCSMYYPIHCEMRLGTPSAYALLCPSETIHVYGRNSAGSSASSTLLTLSKGKWYLLKRQNGGCDFNTGSAIGSFTDYNEYYTDVAVTVHYYENCIYSW